jgi:hypothetical protein
MMCRVVWKKFTYVLEVPAASILIALLMETTGTSLPQVNLYQTTWRNAVRISDLT